MSNMEPRRSEKAGIVRLVREMGSALLMALTAIVYLIQVFRIPTGSMENSLLAGDQLNRINVRAKALILYFFLKP